jgi:hypothetical protein
VTDIVKLRQQCEVGIAQAQYWSDRLAADALATEPGPTQRFSVLGTHALDAIAALWESRLPSIPTNHNAKPAIEHAGVGEYLQHLRNEVQALDMETDPDIDPSTQRMCKRINFEIDLLCEEANRIGVEL